MTKKSISSKTLAELVIRGMQEVKGHNIKSIDLRKIPNSVSDFFVICHGTSDTHVEALSQSVVDTVRSENSELPSHKEGTDIAEWILLDYFNVVVHIFREEARNFYNLEALWADAEVKEIAYQM